MSSNLSKYPNKKTNFIKKIFEKIKENFMCDEIKNNVSIPVLKCTEIRTELFKLFYESGEFDIN